MVVHRLDGAVLAAADGEGQGLPQRAPHAAAGVTNDFGWHTYSPHSDFVARYLRTGKYLDQALEALARFTRYFSAEVAVRDSLNDFPDETMKAVDAWARDQDHRTRRLASEATRPLLPCAPRISLPDDVALPFPEQLYGDSSTYVRTSVANHLHDLSVTQPDLVLATLQRWKVSGPTLSAGVLKLIEGLRHGWDSIVYKGYERGVQLSGGSGRNSARREACIEGPLSSWSTSRPRRSISLAPEACKAHERSGPRVLCLCSI